MDEGPRMMVGGRYELVSKAGIGGMGTVWKALAHGEEGFSRTVAVKRMRPWVGEETASVAQFVEEARLASELTHPNIVQVFDFCRDDDGRLLLVMEWVEGLSFSRYLSSFSQHGKTAPWQVVTAIGIEVLLALRAAHSRRTSDDTPSPIFHRDVTPSNVLLSTSGIAKLADFGLAVAMDRVTTTQPGILKGKLSYMAPEYMSSAVPTAQSDLYSLGVALWEGLVGKRLRKTLAESHRAGDGSVPPLADYRSDLPPALVDTIDLSLKKDPSTRLSSANEMIDRLRRALTASGARTDEPDLAKSFLSALARMGPSTPEEAPDESGEWPAGGSIPPI